MQECGISLTARNYQEAIFTRLFDSIHFHRRRMLVARSDVSIGHALLRVVATVQSSHGQKVIFLSVWIEAHCTRVPAIQQYPGEDVSWVMQG